MQELTTEPNSTGGGKKKERFAQYMCQFGDKNLT
jgi:hypothetical protein